MLKNRQNMVVLRVLLVCGVLGSCVGSNIVDVKGLGLVEGLTGTTAWTNRQIYKYYNIPYAQSPAITGRFKPPVSVLPWDDVYNATLPRRACPQLSLLKEIMESKDQDVEDCLTLNIFTPQLPNGNNSELLPVMFYIHGGGFYEGSAKPFPPGYLLEKDVLLVVPQYRISIFGTLCLHHEDAPGNTVLYDQLLALEWVNQHITNFGGDPNQVTIFGQSAGAASVNMMIISPIVDSKLFQRAILQSGSAISNWATQNDPIKYATDLYLQLTGRNESASISEMVETLENATVVSLIQNLYSLKDDKSRDYIHRGVIQKVGNRKFVAQHPFEYIKQGIFKKIENICGVTKDDGTYFATVLYDKLERYNVLNNISYLRNNLIQHVVEYSGVEDNSGAVANILEDKYFKKIFDKENYTFADLATAISDITGSVYLKAPVFQQAKYNSFYNTTYLYTFDYKGENTRFGYGKNITKYPFSGGVHHSDDLLYLFPYHYTEPLNDKDTKMAKIMVDLWTNFAINGTPFSPLLDNEWEPMYRGGNGPYFHISLNSTMDEDFVHNEYDLISNI